MRYGISVEMVTNEALSDEQKEELTNEIESWLQDVYRNREFSVEAIERTGD